MSDWDEIPYWKEDGTSSGTPGILGRDAWPRSERKKKGTTRGPLDITDLMEESKSDPAVQEFVRDLDVEFDSVRGGFDD